jgi:hypothetical protein
MADLASDAARAQTGGGYRADAWVNVKLPALTKLWQGIGGQSDFFLSEEDAREARGAYVGSDPYRFAQTLWQFAQVEPHRAKGYREGIRELVVDLDGTAAAALCLSNPDLGRGGLLQYYVPGWERFLHATGREYKFGAKSFPKP